MTEHGGKSINLGLIGLGHWPRVAYLPVLEELPDVAVVAVSARSEATRQFAKEQLGADASLYADYRELLNDRDVQAVMIALPNEQHAEAIEAALAADKHVFFEPPMGLSAAENRRVLAAAAAGGRVVAADLELRCLPVMEAVRDKLRSDQIGKPLMAKIRLWCDWGAKGNAPLKYAEEQGFFPWLGHWYLDVLDFLFEAAPTQAAVCGGYAKNGRLMDYGWATLTYPQERLGQFEFNLVAAEGTRITLQAAGTYGEVEADLETGVYRWREDGKPVEQAEAPCTQPVCGFAGMRESIVDFITAIRTDRRPKGGLDVIRRVHEAAMACAESEAQKRSVTVQRLENIQAGGGG